MAIDKEFRLLSLLLLWGSSFFYFANTTTYVPRYLELPVIPAVIVSAYYLARLKTIPSFLRYGFVVYCMISMVIYLYPLLRMRHTYNGMKESSRRIKQATEDDAVVIAADSAGFIEYYARRKTLVVPVNEAERNPRTASDFIEARSTLSCIMRRCGKYR